jgi:hypothetical protein
MVHQKITGIGLMLAALLVSACASPQLPVATEIPKGIPSPTTAEVPTEAAAALVAAVQELAHQLGIDPQSIKIASSSQAEWPNSCLGAPGPDEMCADVITPGFYGILDVNGVQYEFRSDESGDQIRIIPGAVRAAQQALAQERGWSSESVQMVSFEQVMWRDSCLGVEMPNQACLDVITPGYRVVLQAGSEQYVYHTDESGNNLVQAESTLAGGEDVIIVWSQSDASGCQQALISLREVSFGACDGPLTIVPFPTEPDSSDLSYLSAKYASFNALSETGKTGKISFYGAGSEIATPAEQRMIAEWARLTKQVAEAGRAGAAWGLALAWHREGGIAGFCDDLAVHVTGIALALSCKMEQPVVTERIFLDADQLEQLYAWLDSLSTFEIKQVDPGTADAMTIYLQLAGNGEEEASAEVQQAILDFAAQVYTQATTGSTTE